MMQSNKTTTQKDTFTMQAASAAELESIGGGSFWDVVVGVAAATYAISSGIAPVGVLLAVTSKPAY
ncbi:MAG TPA: hypothetical protein VEL76_27830 [Gemmataceae bacterium]|nr:hypothetical protein [Gemmataceae bacterium]